MWTTDKDGIILDLLAADADVSKHISRDKLEPMFDMSYHTKNVDTIFKRVFGE